MTEAVVKRDFRQELTDKFVAALDQGVIPWARPWDTIEGVADKPRNAVSAHEYSGANRLMLTLTQVDEGYSDPRWLTFNQARTLGGGVEKGQKGTPVEYWENKPFWTRRDVTLTHNSKPFQVDPSREFESNWNMVPTRDANTFVHKSAVTVEHDSKQYSWKQAEALLGTLVSKTHTLFNVAQCRDLALEPYDKGAEKTGRTFTKEERGERLLAAMAGDGVRFAEAPNRAFYQPSSDSISLPPREHFKSPELFYGTALHECAHATGHEKRLNRDSGGTGFGSEGYAKEELVAEMASAFIAAETGIPHDMQDHTSYIQSWAAALKNDKNELFRAAKQAGLAADYLISKEHDLVQEQSPEQALREIWTDQGVSAERQDALIAEIAAKAQPGAQVGPFVVGEPVAAKEPEPELDDSEEIGF